MRAIQQQVTVFPSLYLLGHTGTHQHNQITTVIAPSKPPLNHLDSAHNCARTGKKLAANTCCSIRRI